MGRKHRKKMREQGGAVAPLPVGGDLRNDLVNEFAHPVVEAEPARPVSRPGGNLRMEMRSFAGPLPPPGMLAEYDQIHPGTADRIITQFEEQGRHRRKLENRVVWHNVISATTGQVMAFILLLGALGLGGFLLYHDKPVAGLGTIITAVGGAATVLLVAQRARRGDLAAKRDQEKKR